MPFVLLSLSLVNIPTTPVPTTILTEPPATTECMIYMLVITNINNIAIMVMISNNMISLKL